MNFRLLLTPKGFVSYVKAFNRKYGYAYIALKFKLKKNKITYGKNLRINGRVIFSSPVRLKKGDIVIGDNVTINSNGEKYNPLGYCKHSIFRTNGKGKIIIGNNVGMSNVTIVSYNSTITIEDYCTIGAGVKFINTDFHPLDSELRKFGNYDKATSKPIHIKQNAFIGMGSIILKGVTIGENSIIGAGSVVTSNIPDGEIWAGNPAVYIRKIKGM